MDPLSIIAARKFGEVRFSVISDFGDDIAAVLGKVGLTPDESLLQELDRQTAQNLLKHLLWKDLAYSAELMPESKAEEIAAHLVESYSTPSSRYLSNRDSAISPSWNPMTTSTFDSGLLITSGQARFFCIWFQDED